MQTRSKVRNPLLYETLPILWQISINWMEAMLKVRVPRRKVMTSYFQTQNPDKIEMTMTVTMTLEEWKMISGLLPNRWPACDLSSAIQTMVSKATERFYPKSKEETP